MAKVTLVVERGYISLLFKALNLRLVATMAYDIYSWIAHTIGKFTEMVYNDCVGESVSK